MSQHTCTIETECPACEERRDALAADLAEARRRIEVMPCYGALDCGYTCSDDDTLCPSCEARAFLARTGSE